MTDHELLAELLSVVSTMAADIRAVKAETAGLAKAFHDVNGHLSAIAADGTMTGEQMQIVGVRLAEMESLLTVVGRRLAEVELSLATRHDASIRTATTLAPPGGSSER